METRDKEIKLHDKSSITFRLNPGNETRLDDHNMLDVFRVLNQKECALVIDSTWITQMISNGNVLKQEEYRQRILTSITTSLATRPLLLLPLYDDEHWSLVVIITEKGPGNYRYFHLDSGMPGHSGFCDSVLEKLAITTGESRVNLFLEVPQQEGEFECGHFVLMNAAVIISFFENEVRVLGDESIRKHLQKEIITPSTRNMRSFEKKIANLIKEYK